MVGGCGLGDDLLLVFQNKGQSSQSVNHKKCKITENTKTKIKM